MHEKLVQLLPKSLKQISKDEKRGENDEENRLPANAALETKVELMTRTIKITRIEV